MNIWPCGKMWTNQSTTNIETKPIPLGVALKSYLSLLCLSQTSFKWRRHKTQLTIVCTTCWLPGHNGLISFALFVGLFLLFPAFVVVFASLFVSVLFCNVPGRIHLIWCPQRACRLARCLFCSDHLRRV